MNIDWNVVERGAAVAALVWCVLDFALGFHRRRRRMQEAHLLALLRRMDGVSAAYVDESAPPNDAGVRPLIVIIRAPKREYSIDQTIGPSTTTFSKASPKDKAN